MYKNNYHLQKIRERANDELTKAYACKVQCLNKIK